MVAFRVAFAGGQRLDRPLATVAFATQMATLLTLRFDRPILYGDTADLDAWTVVPVFGSTDVIDVKVIGGEIRLTLDAATALTSASFVGPQPIFRVSGGAVLESFTTPVPFP